MVRGSIERVGVIRVSECVGEKESTVQSSSATAAPFFGGTEHALACRKSDAEEEKSHRVAPSLMTMMKRKP